MALLLRDPRWVRYACRVLVQPGLLILLPSDYIVARLPVGGMQVNLPGQLR